MKKENYQIKGWRYFKTLFYSKEKKIKTLDVHRVSLYIIINRKFKKENILNQISDKFEAVVGYIRVSGMLIDEFDNPKTKKEYFEGIYKMFDKYEFLLTTSLEEWSRDYKAKPNKIESLHKGDSKTPAILEYTAILESVNNQLDFVNQMKSSKQSEWDYYLNRN